eukprot:gene27663-35698_t
MRGDGDDDGDAHHAKRSKSNASLTPTGVKAVAKKAKQQVLEKEKTQRGKSASELTMKKVRVVESDGGDEDGEGGRKKVRVKVVRQSRAVGGLDFADSEWASSGEDIANRMSKKKLRKLQEDMKFTDFDSNKRLRKGGKAGTTSFKSKKRFKRR